MEAHWFAPTVGKAHEGKGKGKGDIIAVRLTDEKELREWLVGSPPVWYKPPVNQNQDQKDAWKTKDKTDLTIHNLNLGADAPRMNVYRAEKAKFLIEDGNPLVDPFLTKTGGACAGAGGGQTGTGGTQVQQHAYYDFRGPNNEPVGASGRYFCHVCQRWKDIESRRDL
jgi:hypothetical protein